MHVCACVYVCVYVCTQVAHRDIKLDNTLLSGHNPPYIKICDFGFARGFGEDSLFSTVIGV